MNQHAGVHFAERPAARSGGSAAVIQRSLRKYRRYWKTSIVVSIVTPVLYLAALGVGLGGLIDAREGGSGLGTTYLAYIAPALIAATAMEIGASEASFPVIGGFEWDKSYFAMHSTPLTPQHLLRGTIGWVAIRMLLTGTIFYLITAAFGAAQTWQSVLAVPLAAYGALALCVPLIALSGWLRRDGTYNFVFRFVVVPMMLFAGTFYEIDALPRWGQVIAWFTPLWHTNELVRWAALGPLDLESGIGAMTPGMAALHLGYLLLLMSVGYAVARFTWRKRLIV